MASQNKDNVDFAIKVFAEHGDFIYRVICARAWDKTQVDDLYHDFFLVLVAKPFPYDVRNTKGYLHKAIVNSIFNAHVRIQRHRTLMTKYANYLGSSDKTGESPKSSSRDGQIERIHKLCARILTSVEQEALNLRYQKGFSHAEAARIMKVKRQTFNRYIWAGSEKIRQFFRDRV